MMSEAMETHNLPAKNVSAGRIKTSEFFDSMAKETPGKSRRLTIAAELIVCERERERTSARIRKNKERIQDLVARLEADESEKARLDLKIYDLKCETMHLE
jgi:hypothetical protein